MATASPMREQVITNTGTPSTVSVSASTWTAVPAAASIMTGRTGAFICLDDAAAGNAYAIINMSSTAPATATTIRPITFTAGQTQLLPLQSGSYLWMLSGSGTASVHILEVIQ